MSTYFEDIIRQKSEHLADLRKTTAEVEREISAARDSLQREFAQARRGQVSEPGYASDACQCEQCQPTHGRVPTGGRVPTQDRVPTGGRVQTQDRVSPRGRVPTQDRVRTGGRVPSRGRVPTQGRVPSRDRVPSPRSGVYAARPLDFDFDPGEADAGETEILDMGRYAPEPIAADPEVGDTGPDEDRTATLISKGRSTAHQPKLSVRRKVVIGAIVMVTLLVVLVLVVSGGGGSWPASVAQVQGWIEQACRNPNVMSEPGQVNFACAKDSRQILWVFSLITSDNNPSFADSKSGRQGLEPITPGQGGQVAAALNLHHPYDPSNPVDSIQVAARAINDIIGGVTVTGTNGSPMVQPGLESSSANCLRYTGSAALNARQGYPDVCARPLTAHGQAALVRDVYRKWVVGAPSVAARDAAILFQNAKNPGSPQVQYILSHPPASPLSP